jgi:hypothetical protein
MALACLSSVVFMGWYIRRARQDMRRQRRKARRH